MYIYLTNIKKEATLLIMKIVNEEIANMRPISLKEDSRAWADIMIALHIAKDDSIGAAKDHLIRAIEDQPYWVKLAVANEFREQLKLCNIIRKKDYKTVTENW